MGRFGWAVLVAVFVASPVSADALVGPPAPEPAGIYQVRGYDSRDAHRDAWEACGATALDLGSTEIVIARGGRELVPFFQNRLVRVGVGVLGCVALHDAASHDPERARTWSRIGKVVRGLAFAWNVKEILK